ncbi:hypothetical protein AXX12_15110 [Anaerosporomusa subterranea]|uniref:Uncharacterized protein n=1 Tax=Anaerosporomusa subterranea TaxID=1794912 RepID=A0A154BLR1_ANASB|nr:hypothetical protein [Anaerosporomusa subterranea]KYZ74909.1 hypothetical protein AXX12_15110 [Anaerosporomusa subterranea]
MKKTIATFVLGGFITAGAFGLAYGLPITSAAEKTAPAMIQMDPKATADMMKQCTEMMKNPEMQKMMQTMMPEGDSKAADPKATADMMKQCAEMMKNPEMQTMMNPAQTNSSPAEETNHLSHHQ